MALEMILAKSLEYVGCNFCGSLEYRTVYKGCTDNIYGLKGEYNIVRCESCGLLFLNPRPSRNCIGQYYPKNYGSFLRYHSLVENSRFMKMVRNIFLLPYHLRFGDHRRTFSPFGTKKLLDVGCGTGDFLLEMEKMGWEVYGYDINDEMVKEAKSIIKGSNRIVCGTTEEHDFPEEFFDLITMNHTLEHMHDPLGILTKIYHWLKSDGKLIIAVPNTGSWEAKIFRRYWAGLDLPRHLYHFTEITLASLQEKAGFRVLKIRPQIHPSSVSESIEIFLSSFIFSRDRIWKTKIFYYLLFPFIILSYALGNFGVIEVVCSKKISD